MATFTLFGPDGAATSESVVMGPSGNSWYLGPFANDAAAEAAAGGLAGGLKDGMTYLNTGSDKTRIRVDGTWVDYDAAAQSAISAAAASATAAEGFKDLAEAAANGLASTLVYFPEVASTNLADPDRVEPLMPTRADQRSRLWTTGSPGTQHLSAQNQTSFPTQAALRRIPLPPSDNYVVSIHNAPANAIINVSGGNIFYRKVGGALGTIAVTLTNGNRQVAFAAPSDFEALLLNVRNFVDFSADLPITAAAVEQIERAVMVNQGVSALPFSPWAVAGARAPDPVVFGLSDSAAITVVIQSPYTYIRRRHQLSADRDIVEQVLLWETPAQTASGAATRTGVVDFTGTRLIPRATADTAIVGAFTLSTEILSLVADQRTPIKINNTHLGGGHGIPGTQITATAHGVTSGTIYQDATAKQFVAVRAPNANTLWLIAKNTGTATKWIISSNAPSGTLTKVSGTGSATITGYTGAVAIQLTGILQNLMRRLHIDGKAISADGVYKGTIVGIDESYDIGNAASVLDYIVANPGTSDFANPAIDRQVSIINDYRWNPWGGRTLYFAPTSLQPYGRAALGAGNLPNGLKGVQWQRPSLVGDSTPGWASSVWLYAAGMNPVGGIDYRALANVTANNAFITFPKASAINPADPPSHWAFIGKDGSGNILAGHVCGYHRLRGAGVPARRAILITDCAHMSSAEKLYLYLLDSAAGDAVAGEVEQVVAWDSWFAPTDADLLIPAPIYTVGETHFAAVTCYGAKSRHWVALPDELVGRSVSLVLADANVTLDTDTVQSKGVMLSFGGAVNEVILQIGGAS